MSPLVGLQATTKSIIDAIKTPVFLNRISKLNKYTSIRNLVSVGRNTFWNTMVFKWFLQGWLLLIFMFLIKYLITIITVPEPIQPVTLYFHFPRTEAGRKTVKFRGSQVWNALPTILKSLPAGSISRFQLLTRLPFPRFDGNIFTKHFFFTM